MWRFALRSAFTRLAWKRSLFREVLHGAVESTSFRVPLKPCSKQAYLRPLVPIHKWPSNFSKPPRNSRLHDVQLKARPASPLYSPHRTVGAAEPSLGPTDRFQGSSGSLAQPRYSSLYSEPSFGVRREQSPFTTWYRDDNIEKSS